MEYESNVAKLLLGCDYFYMGLICMGEEINGSGYLIYTLPCPSKKHDENLNYDPLITITKILVKQKADICLFL